jgi:hypothetical protein
MPEPPDLSSLAKRYVELWQDYLTAAAADPDLADSLARLLAGMGEAVALSPWSAWLRTASAARERSERAAAPPSRADEQAAPQPATDRPGESEAGATARAAPVAAPPHERDDGLAEFARRIARLDERLAAIEADARAGTHGGRPRARSTARRRRS